ncbi:MAG: hypothetical protein NZ932_06695 [Candidatus Bathyarchaeota archaeon]|nr:hypothetical protein [Candidatus Bathyarchaeota archaeon]MDW8040306.1 hypothetical protein [Nitrososphaerota archaeon]
MNKLEIMEKFMYTFVGNGIHLIIKEQDNSYLVHTIEIMQKVDESCIVKEIPVGEYFLHLGAVDKHGQEASIICNWSPELLQNLLENSKMAKEAGCSSIIMFREPSTNNWMIVFAKLNEPFGKTQTAYVV